MGFLFKMIRTLFFQIDKVIYGFIDPVYGLLLQLSRTSIFSHDAIAEFSKRIYAFIGIFMLFKVSVSLVTYILNPDTFADKEKGFGTIIKNIIFALVMVVLCPYIFNEAYELQSIILEENTIMNIAFGAPSQNDMANSAYADSAGGKIQFTLLYAFAQPNYTDYAHDPTADLIDCRYTYYKDPDKGNEYTFRKKAIIKEDATDEENTSKFIYELDPSCWGVYDSDNDKYVMEGSNGQLVKAFINADMEEAYQNYAQGVAQQNFRLFFKKEAILAKGKDEEDRYLIDYRYPISTAVGVATVYLLLLFCIDVAIRSVKLGFLEMIAPIPILSYVDPKSSKDGMFKKWFDMCWKTYIDLFIRLFALYFGIYVITLVGQFRDVISGELIDNSVAKVFMIIGVLIFAKKLPEILKEIFNIKGDGKFNLNPLKRFEEEALFGKNITGAAAGVAGGTIGALTGAGALRGLTGGISGAFGGKGLAETWKNTKDKNSKYRTGRLNGSTLGGRLGARIEDALGTGGELARIEAEKKRIQDQIDAQKNEKERLESEIAPKRQKISQHKKFADSIKAMEERAKSEIQAGNGGAIGQEYLRRKANYDILKNQGASATYKGTDGVNRTGADAIARAESEMNEYLNDTGMKLYMTEASAHKGFDATFDGLRESAVVAGNAVGVKLEDDGKEIHKQFGNEKGDIGTLERDILPTEQLIENCDTNIKSHTNDLQDINRREAIAKANNDVIK